MQKPTRGYLFPVLLDVSFNNAPYRVSLVINAPSSDSVMKLVLQSIYLLIYSTGARDFKKGQVCALYAHKKQGIFNSTKRRYGLKPGKSAE